MFQQVYHIFLPKMPVALSENAIVCQWKCAHFYLQAAFPTSFIFPALLCDSSKQLDSFEHLPSVLLRVKVHRFSSVEHQMEQYMCSRYLLPLGSLMEKSRNAWKDFEAISFSKIACICATPHFTRIWIPIKVLSGHYSHHRKSSRLSM